MDIGMLWFDDSSRTTEDKIMRAVAFYAEKHGRTPTLCIIHPSMSQPEGSVGGVQVRAARFVLPHHFLVGVEDEKPNVKGGSATQLTLDLKAGTDGIEKKRMKRAQPAVPALDGQAA